MRQAVARGFSELGRLDIVIANAARYPAVGHQPWREPSVHQSGHQLAPNSSSGVLRARTTVAIGPGGLLPGKMTDS
jgi:NAD(P)-dependent dehydrogenase (short-subunit alcohol dehydrogenase family)